MPSLKAHTLRIRLPLVVILFGSALGLFAGFPDTNVSGAAVDQPVAQPVSISYLPLIVQPPAFRENNPIWVDANTPTSPQVVLFRGAFILDDPLNRAELLIFADTRYQVWLDGHPVGEGPARFSVIRREYDRYALDTLSPGTHLVAALVQWAPNARRSESTTPYLQAQVQGVLNGRFTVVDGSGGSWKAMLSEAWRQDSAPVHAWGLIGPTELLDLGKLPVNWMQPSFPDRDWSAAILKSLSTQVSVLQYFVPAFDPTAATEPQPALLNQPTIPERATGAVSYQPRSIPQLTKVLRAVKAIDAGLLSPGWAVGELVPPISGSFALNLDAAAKTPFQVETLSASGPPPSSSFRLDGNILSWEAAGDLRPDVYVSQNTLSPGDHKLIFSKIPQQGLTFAVPTAGVHSSPIPFQQGTNAGRRTLLAELASHPDQVTVSTGENLSLGFNQLPAYVVLDLGRVIQGKLSAQVSGPAGTVIDIGWDERLFAGARPLPYPGSLHPEWDQVDSWVLDGASRDISTIDTRAGRYILIAVWGNGPVSLDQLQVYEERYPVSQEGAFSSSDPRLNQVWQVGVDTVLANMSDAYADPWRERGQWWGDAYVDDHTNLVAFGDTALLRRGLSYMADAFSNGRPDAMAPNGDGSHMLDYGMLWAQSLNSYWQLSRDVDLLDQAFPVLKSFISYLKSYENPQTGLLDIPMGPWSTTALVDWAGYESRYGQSTAINALYYATLLDGASLAKAAGDEAIASAWHQKADALKKQINNTLYLASQHRYLSSIRSGDPRPASPHAQAWALAYGLVPNGEENAVASSLMQLMSPDPAKPNVEIYGMFWVLDALGQAGRVQDAISLIKSYYGRLLDLGATTWWEAFNANSNYWATLSHGWGSGPTWFLTRYVLGAQRTGADSWWVRPAFAGVDQVTGALPLKDGNLQVSWDTGDCKDLSLNLDAPVGSFGQAVIPFNSNTMTILLNGTPIWVNGAGLVQDAVSQPDGIHVPLQSGHFTFSISGVQPACSSLNLIQKQP